MCSVFDLQSCDRESQLQLVQSLLDMGRRKEAVTYGWKFKLQDHLSMEEVRPWIDYCSVPQAPMGIFSGFHRRG